MTVMDVRNARHYSWGERCDGWHLLESDALSVIEERMPAGAGERLHRHAMARQFFYVLQGRASIELDGVTHALESGQALHVPPGTAHRLHSTGPEDLRFLVVSAPRSHGDREDIDP